MLTIIKIFGLVIALIIAAIAHPIAAFFVFMMLVILKFIF